MSYSLTPSDRAELRNRAALASGQSRYDNALPPEYYERDEETDLENNDDEDES